MRTALVFALAGSVAWLYAEAGRGLVVQWITSPDASYGAILAAVSIAVLWKRRHAIVPQPGVSSNAVGGLLVDLRAGSAGPATLGIAAICGSLAVGRFAATIRMPSIQGLAAATVSVLVLVPPLWTVVERVR